MDAWCCLCSSRFVQFLVLKRKLLHRQSARTECSILKSLIKTETPLFAYPRGFLCVTKRACTELLK